MKEIKSILGKKEKNVSLQRKFQEKMLEEASILMVT